MNNRTLIKVEKTEHCLIFKTINPVRKSRDFYLTLDEYRNIPDDSRLITKDMYSFGEWRIDRDRDVIAVNFTWLRESWTDQFAGYGETVYIPFREFHSFVYSTATEYKVLSVDIENSRPQVVLHDGTALRNVVGSPILRRKLSKFLKYHFQWPRSKRIDIFSDGKYDFFFRETNYNDTTGICGGIILHRNGDDLSKASYGIHT